MNTFKIKLEFEHYFLAFSLVMMVTAKDTASKIN